MQTTTLRKVGGSVMLAVPPAILESLDLRAGASVALTIDAGRLVVAPRAKPRYTLAELLAASDYPETRPPEEREWIDAPAMGGKLI